MIDRLILWVVPNRECELNTETQGHREFGAGGNVLPIAPAPEDIFLDYSLGLVSEANCRSAWTSHTLTLHQGPMV